MARYSGAELSWMTPNVTMRQTVSSNSRGGIMSGIKRAMGGGGLLLTEFETTGGRGFVAFSAKLPGHIVGLDVSPDQTWIVHRDGFVCGTEGVVLQTALNQSIGGALFGHIGFLMQRLEGQGFATVDTSSSYTDLS